MIGFEIKYLKVLLFCHDNANRMSNQHHKHIGFAKMIDGDVIADSRMKRQRGNKKGNI